METTIYTDPSGFDTLSREWDDLLERSDNAPFFMRHVYQETWWKHLGNDNLHLMSVRNNDRQLVGLAPLYKKTDESGQQQLTFVGCVDVSDYLDLLVDSQHTQAVHEAFLDCLASPELGWNTLYLCSLPHNSSTHTRFADAAAKIGWQVEVRQQDVCPVITLPGDWDTYLAGINKKQRHEIRRKMRKIESEAETRWYVIDSMQGLDKAMDDFIALHQKSTADKEDFWSEKMLLFFKSLAVNLAEAGWLKLYFIEVDGNQAAAMLCFDYNNEFLLYNSGYDPDQFRHLSPGNVLTSYTVQHAIELGRSRYDFLRGDEIYKFRFGAEAEPVYDLIISR